MNIRNSGNSLAVFALGVIAFAMLVTVTLWISQSRMKDIGYDRTATEAVTAYGLIDAYDRLNGAIEGYAGDGAGGLGGLGGMVASFEAFSGVIAKLDAAQQGRRATEGGEPGALAGLQDFTTRFDGVASGALDIDAETLQAESSALRASVFAAAQGLDAYTAANNRRLTVELELFSERVLMIAMGFVVFAGALIWGALVKNKRLDERRIALEASEAKLTELSFYRRQFLANMSHELRTPLNAISGFSEVILIQKDTLPREGVIDYVGHVFNAAQDLKRLTDDALDLSKIDAGAFDLNTEEAYVQKLFEDSVIQFRAIAGKRGIALRSDSPARLGLTCDRQALKRCISNLLTNAIKFSPDDAAIDLLAYPRGSDVFVIEVKDRGCGIPEKELRSIWMVYARSSLTRKNDREGAGLGLAITKAIIDAHDGFVEVQSKVGVGTSVRLCLPSALVSVMEPPAGLAQDRAAGAKEGVA